MKEIRLLFVFLAFSSTGTFAQYDVDCEQNYEVANRLYLQGRLDSALNLMKPCLANDGKGTPAQLRGNIFKLAAQINILLDREKTALHQTEKFLEARPYYKVNPTTDIARFQAALDTMRSLPRLSFGIRLSRSRSYVKQVQNYSTLVRPDEETFDEGTYTPKSAMQFAISGTYGLTQFLSLKAEVGFNNYCFLYQTSYNWSINVSRGGEPIIEQIDFLYDSDQRVNYIALPLSLVYFYKPQNKYVPFLEVGGYAQYMTQAFRSMKLEYVSSDRGQFLSDVTSDVLVNELFRRKQAGLLFGGGLMRNVRRGQIRLDLRYMLPLTDAERIEGRYANEADAIHDILFRYYDVLDELRIRNVEIGVTFAYNLKYKILKKKSKFIPFMGG